MLDEVRSENQAGPEIAPRAPTAKRVGHFRQILLWPVELVPTNPEPAHHDFAAVLATLGPDNPWKEIEDEFTGDPKNFQERHYNEFVTFLPPVQRFLYGSGRAKVSGGVSSESPITTFRRTDVSLYGLRSRLAQSRSSSRSRTSISISFSRST